MVPDIPQAYSNCITFFDDAYHIIGGNRNRYHFKLKFKEDGDGYDLTNERMDT